MFKLYPKQQEIYDKILAHFDTTPEIPFYLLAGQRSGKNTIAARLIEQQNYAAYYMAATKQHAVRVFNVKEYQVIAATENNRRRMSNLLPIAIIPSILVVDDYEWLANVSLYDLVIEQALKQDYRVLILSSQGTTRGKYQPTVKYSTWDIEIPFWSKETYEGIREYDPESFHRDYGGGTPYPY